MRFHPALLALLCLPLPGSRAQVAHKRPSALAESVGKDLPWETNLDKALLLAAESKRPILWYPPTVPGSRMDRKPELDLYMRAGIFAEPTLRSIFKHFVLLRRVPSAKEARRYKLQPFQFIEPGFLILDGEGQVLDRCSGMSSFPRPWLAQRFASRLEPRLRKRILEKQAATSVGKTLVEFAQGRFSGLGLDSEHDSAQAFLAAAALFENGAKMAAREAWSALAKRFPDDPNAARAQAEVEGFGPIARGFWSWTTPRKGTPLDLAGTTLPATVKEQAALVAGALRYLVRSQEENGGFEDSTYDFGGQDSLPNVHVAITALVATALHRHRQVLDGRGQKAMRNAMAYVLEAKHRNPADKDEWSWARLYALHMCKEILSGKPDADVAKSLQIEAGLCVKDLLARQGKNGAFRHEYANPFVTASVLLALGQGRKLGTSVAESALKRALTSLEKARTRQGAFSYSQPRGKARATLVAAAGRMPLCEGALFAFGRSTEDKLIHALETSFQHHEQLESTRKYDDHANRHAYGGFFYWYDQLGRRMAMDLLGAKADRFRQMQLDQVLAIPEIDGSFVDSHELGKSYGTAMALLCLEPSVKGSRKRDQDR